MKNLILVFMLPFMLFIKGNDSNHNTTTATKITKSNVLPTGDSLVTFIPTTVGPYCPKILLGGDREFDGHGPEIWSWINLSIVDKKYIVAEVYLHARETVSDWSETEGTWKKTLYTAPAGYDLVELVTGKHSEVHYISRPGMPSFSPRGLLTAIGGQKGNDVPFKDDGLVTRWNIVGDTGGADISDDDNCNDDTQVAIQLNPMLIKLRKQINLKKFKPVNKPIIQLKKQK
ncbi:MAG: hypothetical protein ABIP30_03685 [Ferruginibacter sp.]